LSSTDDPSQAIPSHRFTVTSRAPTRTFSTKLASRVFFTRWAISAIIQSSGFSSHVVAPGAR